MTNEKIFEIACQLQGVSYHEWAKLKMAIDEYFRIKTGEFERQLKLSDDNCMQRVIRSQFG